MTLVSVITPTFQRPQRLWQALESAGGQTYSDVEIVVINNGGASVESIIARYRQKYKHPIKLVELSEPQTIGTARNIGVSVANGEFIGLLDDDDRYRPTHVERLVNVLKQEQDAALAYDDALILVEDSPNVDNEPHVIASCRLGLPYEKQRFEQDDYILTSAIVMRREAFDAINGFDSPLEFCSDWDLLLRLRDQGSFLYVPGEIGVEYSMRIMARDNYGSTFGSRRRAALDYLMSHYNLPPLVPKTFYDVARDLGCEVIPVPPQGC